jgi:hypothetical protein
MSTNRLCLYQSLLIILAVVCSLQMLFTWGHLIRSTNPHPLVVINEADPFIAEQSREFDLPWVIQRYDQVISAIEQYRQDHGSYPPTLAVLVPRYLPVVPDISIRNGEELVYAPATDKWAAPFTFYIYGHYPGLAFMHGWSLRYCPATLEQCSVEGDRHIHPFRINYRWIWISSSAL